MLNKSDPTGTLKITKKKFWPSTLSNLALKLGSLRNEINNENYKAKIKDLLNLPGLIEKSWNPSSKIATSCLFSIHK